VREQDDGRRQIWTYELASGKGVQLTRDGDHWAPMWARSGHALVYAKATSIGSDLIMQALDGGQPVRLGGNDNRLFPVAFADADQTLIVSQPGAPSKMPIALRTPREAALSPDGRWLAFAAQQPGTFQVFIQSHPPTGEPRQVTSDGGRYPVWSHDGRQLFYRRPTAMYSVAIDTARGLTWKAPQRLFEGLVVGVGPEYDVAPDGRFVTIIPDPQERAPRPLNVIMNWASELLTRVPIRR
jgi:Tol biopolymer transport system component